MGEWKLVSTTKFEPLALTKDEGHLIWFSGVTQGRRRTPKQ